jgi:1-acyl-sn-glycerol-3-phosphate acyltransferase
MRRIVADGHALGLFVEGTRQRAGVPGEVQPGAAMVAIQESVPVVPVAIHGTQRWRVGNFAPVSIAWGEPIELDGLPKGGRGYRIASQEIQREIRRLWDWLVVLHEQGRRGGVPPAAERR